MTDYPPLHRSLVVLSGGFLLLLSALVLSNGLDEASIALALRVSSLTTALSFWLVFALAPLQHLGLIGRGGDWLQQHQRDLWVIAGISHLIHLGQIGLYYKLGQTCSLPVWLVTIPLWIILTLFAVFALIRPEWLLVQRSRSRIFYSPGSRFPSAKTKALIFELGSWYIWLIFTLAFVLSIVAQHLLFYNLPAAVLFLAVAVLRVLPRGLSPAS